MASASRRWVLAISLVLLVSALAASAPAYAQGGSSAVVTGIITDAQAGVLPGVTVTLRNIETGTVRSTVSEADGRYRFAGLLPGRYALTAELQGFASNDVTDITLTIGRELQQNLTMVLAGVQESVTVTGVAPVVETSTTEVAAIVTQEQIEMLPIANRQPGSLALLLPGTQMPTGTRRARPSIGAGGANANQMTKSYVDGALNQIYNSGQEFLEVPQAGLREFRVNISGASAQYSSVGGVVLTATKAGTNQFHGEVFEFFRDDSLNAFSKIEKERHERLGEPKPEYRRHQQGGGVGGPIIQDRLHFFTAYERTEEPKTAIVNTGLPQFYGALEGAFDAPYKRRQFLVRGDLQINNAQSAFVRYIWDKEMTFCESCGGNDGGFVGTDTSSPRDSLLVAHTWVVSSRMLNEFRAQVPPSHLENLGAPPGVEKWPADRRGEFPPERFEGLTPVYNFPSFTWGSAGSSNNNTDRWDISNDVTISTGRHTFKVGGAYLRFRSLEEQLGSPLGSWTFAEDQFFDGSPAAIANLRTPILFSASFPPLPRPLQADWFNFYVNDEWRPRSNLTINLGLRYENQYKSFNNHLDDHPVVGLQFRPRLRELIDPASRSDNDNFGPRLGVAWDVQGDGRTVVRGATGKHYGTMFVGALRGEVVALSQTSISIRNPSYPDPYRGLPPESFASGAPPNVFVTDDDIEQPETWHGTVGASRELVPNLALHVDGVISRATKMNQRADINTPDPVTGRRPRPDWGQIREYAALGEHDYNALFVRLDKRLANRHQYTISYTLAKEENTGGTGELRDFYNPELDRGPGQQDRRHVLVLSGAAQLPYDVVVGGVWSLRSTRPFSAQAGRDLNRNGVNNDFVPGTTSNVFNRGNNESLMQVVNAWRAENGRGPLSEDQIATDGFNRFDVRASKAIPLGGSRRLDLIAQVFNVFGTDSLGGSGVNVYVINALSNSFGTINRVHPRQQGELAVRFVW